MRIFNSTNGALWLWILVTFALWSRQFLEAPFRPSPNTGSARLIQYPEIAALELCIVAVLIALTSVVRTRPNWKMVGTCAAAWICAFYHLFVYSIGVDMLLIYAVMPVFYAYMKPAKST